MNKNIYSISQVNNYIKMLLEDDVLLNNINIEGEISNFKEHSSGHLYFSIKDESSSINAVMYRNNAYNINFEIKNGMKAIIFGYISSYTKTGQYQIYVEDINILGKGDLEKDLEKLKAKLYKAGFFDERNKKPISKSPNVIGVITSPTGAAIKDIINIYNRRNKTVKLILIPSTVQGENAHLEIINAINIANEYKNIDTLILTRGGGAYEDLACFNNEEVAKAIYFSKIPIITGIGHEIDFTISDFVADLRAPTPSAAIELALPESHIFKENIIRDYDKLNKMIDKKIKNYKVIVENNINSIQKSIDYKIKENKLIVNNMISKLDNMSPTNILKNGYAFISNNEGKCINSIKDLKTGDIVDIQLFDGKKKAKIF